MDYFPTFSATLVLWFILCKFYQMLCPHVQWLKVQILFSIHSFKVGISSNIQLENNSISEKKRRKGKLCRLVKTILVYYSHKIIFTRKEWPKTNNFTKWMSHSVSQMSREKTSLRSRKILVSKNISIFYSRRSAVIGSSLPWYYYHQVLDKMEVMKYHSFLTSDM